MICNLSANPAGGVSEIPKGCFSRLRVARPPHPHHPTPNCPASTLPPPCSKIRRHWRQPLNRATALALLWGKRPCRRPRFIGPPFLPGRSLGDAQLPETCFGRKSPPQERISSAPRRPPEKHHEHRFAQHLLSKIQRADVRLLGGYLRQE